ncbi:lytic transglycosylase domain-containing protein [bacterium]|nr:lytic transglycosylase domain-containing protein [bacterium]
MRIPKLTISGGPVMGLASMLLPWLLIIAVLLAAGCTRQAGADAPEEKDELAEAIESWIALGDMAALYNPGLTLTDRVEIGRAVYYYSALHDLPPMLVVSIIVVESSGVPDAVSPKGAVGLMQVMPWWPAELGVEADLYDIDDNIRLGTFILADNIRRWGPEEGVARYFWGSGRIPDGRYLAAVMKTMEGLGG